MSKASNPDPQNPFYINPAEDSRLFIELATKLKIDAAVVDHYGIDRAWESEVGKIMPVFAIDDYTNRFHAAKLVVNPNYLSKADGEEFDLMSPKSICLSGSMFALLKSHSCSNVNQFHELNTFPPISIYFGASDNNEITLRILQILVAELKVQNPIHVILGINSKGKDNVVALANQFDSVRIHEFMDDIGSIFAIAPLAIGAGGSTIWERLLFNNNCLVIAVADNQIPLSTNLASIGAINFLGEISKLTNQDLSEGIMDHINRHQVFSLAAPKIRIDRHGANRVALCIRLALDEKVEFTLSRIIKKETSQKSDFYADLFLFDLPICQISGTQGVLGFEIQIEKDDFTKFISQIAPGLLESNLYKELNRLFPREFISFGSASKASVIFLIDEDSWLLEHLWLFVENLSNLGFRSLITYSLDSCPKADVCIVLGYTRILSAMERSQFTSVVVVHESPLPEGRGWSPMTWRVLEGCEEMHLSLFEAVDGVDSGQIYLETRVPLAGTELVDELRQIQASGTFGLIKDFLCAFPRILDEGREQTGQPSYYRKRSPQDSHSTSNSTLDELFHLLRVSDSDKYPVTFEKHGQLFRLLIENYNKPRKKRLGG